MSDSNIFIFLALFYTCLFGLMGLVPYTDVTYTTDSDAINDSFVLEVAEDYLPEDSSPIVTFFSNIFSNITGLPSIVNTLLFAPLGIFAVYWIIKFVLNFIPLLGGGA